eukprot:scaffold25145_cov30-Tisochrysis_lutea.AAC.1
MRARGQAYKRARQGVYALSTPRGKARWRRRALRRAGARRIAADGQGHSLGRRPARRCPRCAAWLREWRRVEQRVEAVAALPRFRSPARLQRAGCAARQRCERRCLAAAEWSHHGAALPRERAERQRASLEAVKG